MSDPIRITRIEPPAGVSGGEVSVAYTGVTAEGSRGLGVLFDAKPAHITAIGRGRALVSIPELSAEGAIEVVLLTAEPRQSSGANFMIGRVLTLAPNRGTGLGRVLMAEGIARTREAWPRRAIRIAAQQRLEAFYKTLGFRVASSPYIEDDIPHVDMRLEPA